MFASVGKDGFATLWSSVAVAVEPIVVNLMGFCSKIELS